MLNKNTRMVLSQLSAINVSQIITYPVTTIILGRNIQAFVDMRELGEEEFDEIGIFNINELLSVIGIIDDPEITNENGVLTIKGSKSSIKYGTTTVDIIESECRGNPELIQKIKNNENIISFDLDAKELEKIKKMSGVLKDLTDMVVESQDGKILVSLQGKERSSNSYNIEFEGSSTENNKMVMVMDLINKLPNSSFKVNVYKSKKGSLVAIFDSTDVEGLSIVVAAKST
jgi:hypothetical protein